ncbi:MAG: hypothetical protein JXB32_18020 [Deltaproteobacteria bacterium]|nr:hypothetical protein [Deltaproteobacteria bacterium]
MPDSRVFLLAALALVGCYGTTTLEGDAADTAADAAESDAAPDDAGVELPDDGTLEDDSYADVPAEEVSESCLPQQAAADGPCTAELPGVRWDGAHCVPLGSGCSCVGADCAAVYETVADCVRDRRDCYPNDCEPQAVANDTCIDCDDATFLGAFWDGRACFELSGCRCRGAGCDLPFRSREECEAFHETCPAARCAATGGSWFPAQYGGCGFACGGPRDADCLVPFADCLCPEGQTFHAETGCATDPSCTERELCVATRGAWHPAAEGYCGFDCGRPGPLCEVPSDSCDCGPARNFVPGIGCRVDLTCETTWGVDLCTSTGGTWHDCSAGDPWCSCGDYHCGRPNVVDPCVSPGCDCGPGANFLEQGCVPDAGCFYGREGAECNGWGLDNSSCRPGLACCSECGVPGLPCSYCRNPCCGDEPECGADGCPPPPP